MASMSEDKMNEGKAAKLAGQPWEANPYPAGSQNSADWLDGYTFDEREQTIDREDPEDANRS